MSAPARCLPQRRLRRAEERRHESGALYSSPGSGASGRRSESHRPQRERRDGSSQATNRPSSIRDRAATTEPPVRRWSNVSISVCKVSPDRENSAAQSIKEFGGHEMTMQTLRVVSSASCEDEKAAKNSRSYRVHTSSTLTRCSSSGIRTVPFRNGFLGNSWFWGATSECLGGCQG